MYSSAGYQASRTSSAVIPRGDRGVLAVSGPDRLDWLQGLLTNDVVALQPEESCYAAYLTPQGRMITDMRVLNLQDRTLLEVPAGLADALAAKFESLLFAEDAKVVNLSERLSAVDLIGPEATRVSREHIAATPSPPHPVIFDAIGGVPALTFLVPAEERDALVEDFVARGAVETTLETLDVLRIEAGRPVFLVDMDEHTIPLEAGIEKRAISFTKGCYVGQEVIVRVTQRGQGRVAKKLVGLLVEKDGSPHAGDLIHLGDREVGRVTSAAWSPLVERPLALGYVHREFIEPGTHLQVATASGRVGATVVLLPLTAPARPV